MPRFVHAAVPSHPLVPNGGTPRGVIAPHLERAAGFVHPAPHAHVSFDERLGTEEFEIEEPLSHGEEEGVGGRVNVGDVVPRGAF
mmetsp:Transcript_55097/g.64456  ORF Transcript_55097/g.64456 Transcript_55097/m.64456 type:complete len:85 (+) Transcript_55097:1085-1339(+)